MRIHFEHDANLFFSLTELLLEKLTVKLPQVETNLESLYAVLERSPNLTSIYISGVRLSRGHTHDKLLQTITGMKGSVECCVGLSPLVISAKNVILTPFVFFSN